MTALLTQSHRVGTSAPKSIRFLPVAAFGTDLVLISCAVVFALLGRGAITIPDATTPEELSSSLVVAGPLIMLGWVTAIFLVGGYRPQAFGAGLEEYQRIAHASLWTAAAVGIGCYVVRFDLSRGFFVLCFLTGVPALLLGRFALRVSIKRARRHGSLQHRVVIAGTQGHIEEVAEVLRRESWLGYDVVGALTPGQPARDVTPSGIPLLGSARSIAGVAMDAGADVVFLAGGAADSATDIRRLAWDLEHENISLVIAPTVTEVSSERVAIRPVGGMPLIHLEKPRSAAAARRAKRIFDVAGSLSLLVCFAPVFVIAAIAIWRHDRGPVLFRQVRVGRDGNQFCCWKFRTMVTNAEELLADLHRQQSYAGGLFKMEHDPRITPPGRWLRRLSIDELPQLVNVLTGQMSLVGPRPPIPYEVVAQYHEDMARRLRVRPGMTGLWQVSGRSDLSWSEAIRLDLYYVDNWSMLQDLTILARTFRAVLGSRGAY